MNEFLYKLSLAVAPPVYHGLTSLLYATCVTRYSGLEHRDRCLAGGTFIAAFWHYSIYYTIFESRGVPMAAMVSGSRDGEYISRVLQRLGYETVRGSRKKGGLDALKGLGHWLENGRNAGIVADGSQGPPRIAQGGAVLLASRSGRPILPMAWGADRYFTFRSWDRSALPKPFAKIRMCFGEPLRVPAGLRAADLEGYRLELEKRLNMVYQEAWGFFGREEH